MTFLNPLMLWGGLAAVVPLLVHLFGRRRLATVPFPTLRFIRAGVARQRSLSRLRQWLLLALRMLMVLLAAAAFSRPVAPVPWLAAWLPAEGDVCVVVDASASMTTRAGGHAAMDRAAECLQWLRDRVPRAMRVQAYAATTSLSPLRLAEPRATAERGDLLRALSESSTANLRAPSTRLVILSDLQESSLQGRLGWAPALPPLVLDVGAPASANAALQSARSRTRCPLVGRPSVWELSARSWAPAGRRLSVACEVSGRALPGCSAQAGDEPVSLPWRHTPATGGELPLRFSLPPDDYSLDDTLWAVDRVRQRLRVTLISGVSDPHYLALALDPDPASPGPVRPTVLRWSALPRSLPAADLLILADLPAELPAAVDRRLRARARTIIFAGPGAALPEALARALFGTPITLGGPKSPPLGAPLRLSWLDTRHPALAPFASPLAGDLGAFSFRTIRPLKAPDAQIIARFSDGTPALVASALPDRPALLVNASLDTRWTDAPLHPAFVPWVHSMCYDGVGPAPVTWPDGWAGEVLRAPQPPGAGTTATVTDPAGARHTVVAEGGTWSWRPVVPGLHTASWQGPADAAGARFAVNVSPSESDPRRLAEPELRKRLRHPQTRVVGLADREAAFAAWIRGRADLTWFCTVLLAILLVAETLLSGRPRPRR